MCSVFCVHIEFISDIWTLKHNSDVKNDAHTRQVSIYSGVIN